MLVLDPPWEVEASIQTMGPGNVGWLPTLKVFIVRWHLDDSPACFQFVGPGVVGPLLTLEQVQSIIGRKPHEESEDEGVWPVGRFNSDCEIPDFLESPRFLALHQIFMRTNGQ